MKKIKCYCILSVLVVIFLCPGIVAYLCYSHPQWLGKELIHHGTLLTRPVLCPGLNRDTTWRLVAWVPQSSNDLAVEAADRLAKIRLALGRRLYQTQVWLIRPASLPSILSQVQQRFNDQDIHYEQIPTTTILPKTALWFKEARMFIVNPQGYIILTYPLKASQQAIFQDLKHLLNTSGGVA